MTSTYTEFEARVEQFVALAKARAEFEKQQQQAAPLIREMFSFTTRHQS